MEYNRLLQDKQYNELSNEEKEAIKTLVKNYNLPKEKKEKLKQAEMQETYFQHTTKIFKEFVFQVKIPTHL